MKTVSNKIENIINKIEIIIKKEPNGNSEVEKHSWNEKFTIEAQQ